MSVPSSLASPQIYTSIHFLEQKLSFTFPCTSIQIWEKVPGLAAVLLAVRWPPDYTNACAQCLGSCDAEVSKERPTPSLPEFLLRHRLTSMSSSVPPAEGIHF